MPSSSLQQQVLQTQILVLRLTAAALRRARAAGACALAISASQTKRLIAFICVLRVRDRWSQHEGFVTKQI